MWRPDASVVSPPYPAKLLVVSAGCPFQSTSKSSLDQGWLTKVVTSASHVTCSLFILNPTQQRAGCGRKWAMGHARLGGDLLKKGDLLYSDLRHSIKVVAGVREKRADFLTPVLSTRYSETDANYIFH